MSKWLTGFAVAALAATFAFDADAQRRFGGGGSFGRQAPQVQRQAAPPAQSPQAAPTASGAQQPAAKSPAAGAPARPASPWRGALTGLAAGLGIAALANWLGFGEGLTIFLTMLLFGAALMALVGFLVRRTQPVVPRPISTGAGRGPGTYSNIGYETSPVPFERSVVTPTADVRPGSAMDEFQRGVSAVPWGIPAGFDTAQFLTHAKGNFERLQHAWTGRNLGEIAEFTTDELFVALTHELRARPAPKRVDIVSLDAELLGIESTATEHIASVKFDGALRVDGETEAVTEVWNLVKPTSGREGWLLAGIQQLA